MKRESILFIAALITAVAALITIFRYTRKAAPEHKNTNDKDVFDVPVFPLQYGKTSREVKELQKWLQRFDNAAYTSLPVYGADGVYGSETLAAVKAMALPESITKDYYTKVLKLS